VSLFSTFVRHGQTFVRHVVALVGHELTFVGLGFLMFFLLRDILESILPLDDFIGRC